MRILGAMLAAVPLAFAGIRLLTTGTDWRYLWMALGSTVCAAAVLVRPSSAAGPNPLRTGVATITAAAGAAAVAIAGGATAGPGIAIVAVAFGSCSALGTALILRPGARARD